jgi:hypothetical protein
VAGSHRREQAGIKDLFGNRRPDCFGVPLAAASAVLIGSRWIENTGKAKWHTDFQTRSTIMLYGPNDRRQGLILAAIFVVWQDFKSSGE